MSSIPSDKLIINDTIRESVVDGPGFRYVIFVQGCPHRCRGCHNPQTHSFYVGKEADEDKIISEIAADPLISGVTISGGEPFCQPTALCRLTARIREMGKHIMIYTGYTLEKLIEMSAEQPDILALLHMCDVLVDGPFILAQRDILLKFRGSTNQRLIDMHKYFAGESDFLADI